MPQDVFAPLEEAVDRATRTLVDLHRQIARLREERDELGTEVGRLRERLSGARSLTERLDALETERTAVRDRLQKILVRLTESGLDD